MVIYQWLQLGNNFGDLNDILAISWQFLAVYLVFFGCSLVFFTIFFVCFLGIFSEIQDGILRGASIG